MVVKYKAASESLGGLIKIQIAGVPVVAQWLMNLTRNHEVAGSFPALLSGLRIRHCRELRCRLQTRLGSRVAVAVAVV